MTHPMATPARELSEDEAAELIQRIHEADQGLRYGLAQSREGLWLAARYAWTLHDESGWQVLEYDTLSEYLADPEITLTRTTFYRLIQAYEELVIRRQLPVETVNELDLVKVHMVLDKVRSGEVELQDALDDAKELGARDLREKYVRIPRLAKAGPYDGDVDALNKAASGDDVGALNNGDEDPANSENLESGNGVPPLGHFSDSEFSPFSAEHAQKAQAGHIGQVLLEEFSEAALNLLVWVHEELGDPAKRRMKTEMRTELERVLDLGRQLDL